MKRKRKCALGRHEWEGCRCVHCGKTCHEWESCRCARCGTVRDEDHDWDSCTCTVCNKLRDESHESHDWAKDCEKCSKCGKVRVLSETDASHDWAKDCEKCSKCGKVRMLSEIAKQAKIGGVYQLKALEKLTDQAILAEIAKTDICPVVRSAAVKGLTDPTLVAAVGPWVEGTK